MFFFVQYKQCFITYIFFTKKMRIPISIIDSYITLSKQDQQKLFWKDVFLQQSKILPQPWKFITKQKLSVKTADNVLKNIVIIWPTQKETKLHITKKDLQKLFWLEKTSQMLLEKNFWDVVLIWPKWTLYLSNAIELIEDRLLVSVADSQWFKLRKNKKLSINIKWKPLKNIITKVKDNYEFDLQLSKDTANFMKVEQWDWGETVY